MTTPADRDREAFSRWCSGEIHWTRIDRTGAYRFCEDVFIAGAAHARAEAAERGDQVEELQQTLDEINVALPPSHRADSYSSLADRVADLSRDYAFWRKRCLEIEGEGASRKLGTDPLTAAERAVVEAAMALHRYEIEECGISAEDWALGRPSRRLFDACATLSAARAPKPGDAVRALREKLESLFWGSARDRDEVFALLDRVSARDGAMGGGV